MNGLFRLHPRGMLGLHMVSIGRNQLAGGMRGVTSIDPEILHAEAADGSHHPAILVAVIVDAANLTDIPTYGHRFEKLAFVNQVSRVVALRVKKIRGKRLRLNGF